MLRDFMEYERIARTLARDAGLKLELVTEKTVPRTNGKKIVSTRPDPLWSDTEFTLWLDGIYHEIGHNLPENRDIFPLLNRLKIDTNNLFGQLLNLVDDFRVDRTRTEKWAGMEAVNRTAVREHMLSISAKVPYGDSMPTDKQAMVTMLAFDTKCRSLLDPSLSGIENFLVSKFNPAMHGWYDKLEDFIPEYLSQDTAQGEYDLLCRIWQEVFDFPTEKIPEPSDSPEDGEGKREDGDSNSPSEEGEGESDSDGGTVRYEDLMMNPSHDGEGEGVQHKILYPDGEYSIPDYTPHNSDSNKSIECWKGEQSVRYRSPLPRITESEVDALMDKLGIERISGKARQLLQAVTRKRQTFNQKQGRLDTSKISRVLVGGSSAERIFKTKTESKALDTAVSILVDYSASMDWCDKIGVAVAGAIAFANLLRTLNIKHEILGFTESYPHNLLYVFKPFAGAVSDTSIKTSMVTATGDMSNNCDGDSILVAYHRLMRAQASRHVLIVLSDGSPCGGDGDIWKFTKQVVSRIETERRADIVGIGIMDDSVQGIYKHHKVLSNVTELPDAIIHTLESLILKGEV